MIDFAEIKRWAQQTFYKKLDGVSVSRGAIDARRPVTLNSSGKLDVSVLSGAPVLTGLYVDGVLRVRQSGSTRYRSDWYMLSGAANLNAYDDTSAVYLPLTIDTSTLTLRPSADAAKQFTLDASGNIQALGYLGGAWTGLAYTNSGGTTWADFGGAYGLGKYKKFGDMVFLRGLCKRTAGAGTTIAVLPVGYRPTARVFYGVLTNTGIGQIDIFSDGSIVFQLGGDLSVQLDLPPFSTL